MGYLVRIIDLNLSHNKLTELPPDIVNLRGLSKTWVKEVQRTDLN